MKDLRGVIEALSYDGPLEAIGGFLNGVGAIFGGPDNYHHGRGLEITSSLVRTRRPEGKPLLVFIDTNVDTNLLRKAGYAYVGKVSMEGKIDRNWDQVYDAAVTETLPRDVDILLIAGGMKGVTVGSNTSFPGAAGGYNNIYTAVICPLSKLAGNSVHLVRNDFILNQLTVQLGQTVPDCRAAIVTALSVPPFITDGKYS